MITLTEARLKRLSSYLTDELTSAYNLRQNRVNSWRTFISRYEAKTRPKNFPWRNASNVHIPIVATFYDSIKARIMNALKAQDRLLVVEPLTEEKIPGLIDPMTGQEITWRTISELAEQYLLFEIGPSGEVDLTSALDKLLDDVLLLGTGALKTLWDTQVVVDYVDDGQTKTKSTVYNNVRFVNPALEDLLWPPHYDTLDRIPWTSQLYLLRPSEILNRIDTHSWPRPRVTVFLDKNANPSTPIHPTEEQQDAIEGVTPPGTYDNDEYRMAETWMRFDLDGNGREQRILVDHYFGEGGDVSPDDIFRITPWPYTHGKIPITLARYIRRRNRIYGMGIPERLESLDEAISTNINQLIDNQTVANTRMYSAKDDSKIISALSDVYPGKVVPRQEKDDVVPLQLGEIYTSGFELQNILREYAERVGKITDYNLGRESQALGKQSTATATLALLQEGGQYFDNITRDIRRALNESLTQWLDLLVQHQPLTRVRQVLGASAQPFLAALSLSAGDLKSRIGIRIAFSSDAATRELARQEEQAKLQSMQAFYQGLLSLAQLRFTPGTPTQTVRLIDMIAKDSELRIQRLLESYGEYYSNSSLPSWEQAMNDAPPDSQPGLRNAIATHQAAIATGLTPPPGMENGGGRAGAAPSQPPGLPQGGGPGPVPSLGGGGLPPQ